MPKHIVCVHPGGADQMVGDERVVTNKEWEAMKDLKAGPYLIWELKRDMGKDPEDPEDLPQADPTHEAVIMAERGDNPDIDARKSATKRAIKAGERQAPAEED